MPVSQAKLPSYLPTGYVQGEQWTGSQAGGFGGSEDQVAVYFRRGAAQDDWRFPLVVYTDSAGAPDVVGTGGDQPGEVIDLGIEGVTTVYYDGIWMIPDAPGSQQPTDPSQVQLQWDTSTVHSVTVRWSTGTCAVRGPKSRGVGYDELLNIARSLFPSATPSTSTNTSKPAGGK